MSKQPAANMTMHLSLNTGPIQFIGSGADAVNHTLLLELGVHAWAGDTILV